MYLDATHTYRGYRLQALYTLEKILDQRNDKKLVFQPEGLEDLLVLDQSGNLLEAVQVKAYSSDLILSHFKPKNKNCFFYRVNEYLHRVPEIKITVLSFGPIGSELQECFEGKEKERLKVAQKLAGSGHIDEETALVLLSKIIAIKCKEEIVKKTIFDRIRDSMAGVDPERAFELLSWWMYDCAENKRMITQQQIIERINKIGTFLHERRAFQDEWLTSIVPLNDFEVSIPECQQLSKGYYQGMGARYEHILANVDCIRTEKLQELNDKFKQSHVVIVHGASGQGKSSLAYRYIHNYYPNDWRLEVVLVDGKRHALNIARALAGHATALAIPIIVYIDVSPNDTGWTDLVRQLYSISNLRVLVTLREEEWRRDQLSDYMLDFEQMELDFGEDEAEKVYMSLEKYHVNTQFINFAEAWQNFGANGPLLEFVFLLTQGTSLYQRLADQVQRLQDRVRCGQLQKAEIELLRLVAVASAYGARLEIRELVEHLQLEEPGRTIELFENEYLVRQSDDGNYLDGLHPIRSELLVKLLTDLVIVPWVKYACIGLPFMNEDDLEIFLLTSFSRRSEDELQLVEYLKDFHPKRWAGIAGITNSLIWLGIKAYVDENSDLIAELQMEVGLGWMYCLDTDIADAMPGYADTSFRDILSMMPQENRERIKEYRRRQSDKKRVFSHAVSWLGTQRQSILFPLSINDWNAMAEVLFWLQHLDIDSGLTLQIKQYPMDGIIEELPLETLADLVLSLSTYSPDWYECNRNKIIERFRYEKEILALDDDEKKITSHYLINLFQSHTSGEDEEDTFHGLTINRINLMRRLFPNKSSFACSGYGHRVWFEDLPLDSTVKTGINKRMLPARALTTVNGVFRELSDRYYRPGNWGEYTMGIIEHRKAILEQVQKVIASLEHYFSSDIEMFLEEISTEEILAYSKVVLNHSVMFPLTAISEWGFFSEFSSKKSSRNSNRIISQPLSLKSYRTMQSAYSRYISGIRNYFMQFADAVTLTAAIRKYTTSKSEQDRLIEAWKHKGIDTRLRGLSFYNLTDALQGLFDLQTEFINKFSRLLDNDYLLDFQEQERTIITQLWSVWYFFTFQPRRTIKKPQKTCVTDLESYFRAICNDLRQKFRKQSNSDFSLTILDEKGKWENAPAVYISINTNSARESVMALDKCLMTIQESFVDFKQRAFIDYAVPIYCSYFVFIPIVAGNLVNKQAWVFPIYVFQAGDKEIKSWNYLPKELPDDVLSKLKLNLNYTKGLETSDRLMQISSQLIISMKHIQDINRLPELDEIGSDIISNYLPQITEHIIQYINEFMNYLMETQNFINQSSLKDEIRAFQVIHESMIKIIETLRFLEETFFMGNLSVGNFDEAVNAFKDMHYYAEQIYCSIVDYTTGL